MNFRYKIVLLISSLLLLLSIGNSFINYTTSMQATQEQLKTKSLPLSVDNIYTKIQKNIIEPYLISSMMANDTFVKAWIIQEDENVDEIQKYLDSVKNKYGMLVTFLVSEKSKNHYIHSGYLENVSERKETNQWYFDFKEIETNHEINIDTNVYAKNSMLMYINFKIFDENFHYLGATGVGIKVSYINDMLTTFKNDYNLKVSFLDANGSIVFGEKHNLNINSVKELKHIREKLLVKKSMLKEYEYKGDKFLVNTKYISELNMYLLVEAKLSDFTEETQKVFYINMFVSLFLTLVIAIVIIVVINKYHKSIENIASTDTLTELYNRRSFTQYFNSFLLLSQRHKEPLSLLFIDIDDFKMINDSLGHQIGDEVLVEVAKMIRKSIRESDICARWGGEEFIVAFVNTKIEDAVIVSNKIRENIRLSLKINSLMNPSVTISCGVTVSEENDTMDKMLLRADTAMYQAKVDGKDRVCTK